MYFSPLSLLIYGYLDNDLIKDEKKNTERAALLGYLIYKNPVSQWKCLLLNSSETDGPIFMKFCVYIK
jgi:hypothetical protein